MRKTRRSEILTDLWKHGCRDKSSNYFMLFNFVETDQEAEIRTESATSSKSIGQRGKQRKEAVWTVLDAIPQIENNR